MCHTFREKISHQTTEKSAGILKKEEEMKSEEERREEKSSSSSSSPFPSMKQSSSSGGTGHYGRVFSMSFSPAFYIDDDFADEEKESNPLTTTTPTPTKATTRFGKAKRRRRLLATSGEDDCCRLWTTTEWCHSGDCDDEKEEEEEQQQQQQQQVLLEPKPYGLSVLRGHSDAVLKCAFGASGSARVNDGEKSCSRLSSFVLATGSSNGEVFLWRVVRQSGKEKDGEGGDGLLAKFDANRRRGGEIGARADGGGGEEEDNNNNNEVYGLKFLGARDQYLVIATDAELIGVEVTRNVSEDGSSSVGELKEIARAPIGFALNESEGDANSQRGKFDIAYAFAMDAYAMNSRCSNSTSDDKMGDKHILSVGYSNGTMRMYCFDAKAREFYLVGENASVFDDTNSSTGRLNMACTSLTFVNPAVGMELEQFPNVVLCNRFGVLAMSDAKNWIEKTKPRMNMQTDFALTHAMADVGNGFVACCGRMKEHNRNGVALFDAFDVQRGSMFLNASEMMGEHASKYPLLCVGGFAEDVVEEEAEAEESNIRTRITVVAAGGMPAKLVNENFSSRNNAKSLGFSLAKLKVGVGVGKAEEDTKTSRLYVWNFVI